MRIMVDNLAVDIDNRSVSRGDEEITPVSYTHLMEISLTAAAFFRIYFTEAIT